MMTCRSAAATLAFPILALAACGGAGDAPIHLGVAGPLERSNGVSMRLAAEMAVEEINRAGGIHGRPLALVFKDDDARPEQAIAVAAELRADVRVVAVIGHVNSGATIAAAEIYNDAENGLLQISPASSAPAVSDAGAWTFRVCPSDLQHGPALAQWTYANLGLRRAAVLYANDEYGRGVLESFSNAFAEAGGEVVARDPYLPGLFQRDDTLDPYLERAIRNGADALMIAGQADAGLRIVQAARRLGYSGPVLGADGLTNLKDAGGDAEGVFISSAFLPDRPSAKAQAFVRAYAARYEELPDHRGAMTYDAIHLLAQALREIGPDRRRLRDYVASIGSGRPAFEGVSGTIAFDANGDVAGKEVAVGIVRQGALVSAVQR
jgi:branched-chain amino acid transport system substrate-binding protein